jgi:hypothetical protein
VTNTLAYSTIKVEDKKSFIALTPRANVIYVIYIIFIALTLRANGIYFFDKRQRQNALAYSAVKVEDKIV